MEIPFFDLTRQHSLIQKELQESFGDVLRRGVFIDGPSVGHFEQIFSQYTGAKQCVSTANGTDSLEILFSVLDFPPGSEVVVPAFGWISASLAVLRAGLVPVFCEVDSNGNISPDAIEDLITDKTKAIVCIHMFGRAADVRRVKEIAVREKLILIEDCAQAIGTRIDGIHVGLFGEYSIFSFYPTKTLGALGDAGCILSQNQEKGSLLKSFRDYGRTSRKVFAFPGRNSRLDELQAALLLVKVKHLDGWLEQRRTIAKRYLAVIGSDVGPIEAHSWYRFPLQVKKRDEFILKLQQAGIGFDTAEENYVEDLPFFLRYKKRTNAIARQLANEIVCLPLFPELTEDEVVHVCEFLKTNRDLI